MTKLYVVSSFNIHEGKLEEFLEYGRQAIQSVKEKETQTTLYEWFYNEDQTQCTVLEGYENSQAAMIHLGNVTELLGKILQISDFSAKALGDVSPELLQAVAGLNVEVQSKYTQGIVLDAQKQ